MSHPPAPLSRRTLWGLKALAIWMFLAIPAITTPQLVHAQGGYSGSQGWQFGAQPRFFGADGSNSSTIFDVGVKGSGGLDLGCGGIGLFGFIKSTFNIQNIVDQLKTYMQTFLAKTLLTTLMSVPQIAAIFDTLNALGNARFDLFKQSCNIGEIRAAAKQMWVDRCLKDGGSAATCNTDNYDKGNWSGQLSSAMSKVTDVFSGLQNASKVITSAMCEGQSNCPMAGLIPPMRLCFQVQEGKSCPLDTGARQPPVTGATIYDTQFAATQPVLAAINNYMASKAQAQIPDAIQAQAEDLAIAKCRANASTCGQASGSPAPAAINMNSKQDMLVKFKNYIGCTKETFLSVLQEEAKVLGTYGYSVTSPNATIDESACISNINSQSITNSAGEAEEFTEDVKKNICKMMVTGLACTFRNAVNCTDPKILGQISQLRESAQNAYQDRCAANAAITSTKSILNFVRAELQGTAASKINSDNKLQVPNKNATTGPTTTQAEDVDPKTREKYIESIKLMIQYFEAQLRQLEETENANKRQMEFIMTLPRGSLAEGNGGGN